MKENDRKFLIEPSILAGDFGHLADEAKRIEDSGADAVHIDIMDGAFVPNLTMGPSAVAAINRSTDLFLDVHLMIYSPFDYVERFVEAGADRITFHFEATEDVLDTIAFIRTCQCEAGLAFCPETTESLMVNYLDKIDLLLLMTVHPGFGGQAFMPEVLEKIQFARDTVTKLDIDLPIQVDGGIDETTAVQCRDAGANVFVAGTSLFKQPDLTAAVAGLRNCLGEK